MGGALGGLWARGLRLWGLLLGLGSFCELHNSLEE